MQRGYLDPRTVYESWMGLNHLSRPFVFINIAMSADGKISSYERKQLRISGEEDISRVDSLRASCDAIMVGIGTILADDPSLRIKSYHLRRERLNQRRPENPLRLVADSLARTPPQAKVLGMDCLIAVSEAANAERIAELRERCEIVVFGKDRVDLERLMEELPRRGVNRLMVEGGGTLNWSLIQAGLVDEIYVYIGPIVIGGKNSPSLVDGSGFSRSFPQLELISSESMNSGALLRWRVKKNRTTGLL